MSTFPQWRQVLPTSPMMPYKPTNLWEIVPKGLHFGQRKLMLSELEYLTPIMQKASTDEKVLVVYAGAANGLHLPFLFTCFPTCNFILIDPAKFCDALVKMFADKHPQLLDLVNDICTDELCLKIRGRYPSYSIHFISDIRSGNPPDLTNYENTQLINKDNEMQRSWAVSLDAKSVMLKYHPPYPSQGKVDPTPETSKYIPGNMLWGVWGPKSTTEVRLVSSAPFLNTCIYNSMEHEQQCYYYNTTNRYRSDIKAERGIIEAYLKYSTTYKSESAESFSSLMSQQLETPLFLPLSAEFSEDDARTFALLYYARCGELERLFSEWRKVLSFDCMRKWSAGGEMPKATDFLKYAYRKTLAESFNVAPPKRQRE